MNKCISLLILASMAALTGCSSVYWSGSGAGGVGTGAGYQTQTQAQMTQLNEDLKSGKITQYEYNMRKNQMLKG